MKVELVRTDEENERYRQLVETNRQRRQELIHEDSRSSRERVPTPLFTLILIQSSYL